MPEVYAKKLPSGIAETAVQRFFARFGEVTNVTVRMSKDGNRTFGFIAFADNESCQRCVDSSPLTIDDERVYVMHKSPKPHQNGSLLNSTDTSKTSSYTSTNSWDDCHSVSSRSPECNSPPMINSNRNTQNLSDSKQTPKFRTGTTVCVVHFDRKNGIASVQEVLQRTKMFDMSDDINDYNAINSLKPAVNLKLGDKVIVAVKRKFYRGQLLEDLSPGLSDLQVNFIDFGKTTFVKAENIYCIPERFQSASSFCHQVRLDGLSRQVLCEIFKDSDYCLDLFGESLYRFDVKTSEAKWFYISTVSLDSEFPTIKLTTESDEESVNSILCRYSQKFCNGTNAASSSSNRTNNSVLIQQAHEDRPSKREQPLKNHNDLNKSRDDHPMERKNTTDSHKSHPDAIFAKEHKLMESELKSDVIKQSLEACLEYVPNKFADESFTKGEIIMALYQADEMWYRGKVLTVFGDNTLNVLFIDFGNAEKIKKSDCRRLNKSDKTLVNIPLGLIECSLAGNWDCDSLTNEFEKFAEFALNKAFNCQFDFDSRQQVILTSATNCDSCDLLDFAHTLIGKRQQTKLTEQINEKNGELPTSNGSSSNFKLSKYGEDSTECSHFNKKDSRGLQSAQASKSEAKETLYKSMQHLLVLLGQGIQTNRNFMKLIQGQLQAEENLLKDIQELMLSMKDKQ
ncbi:hypothetical protein GJ496_000777 [Pomphorhynchus laevis]|nr:hypothetical protein GJ496_000777 [Pomphorhynchus laevis]